MGSDNTCTHLTVNRKRRGVHVPALQSVTGETTTDALTYDSLMACLTHTMIGTGSYQ